MPNVAMTVEEISAANLFDGKDWSIANPNEAIECPPHEGDWISYFNTNLACGRFNRGCGAKDWKIMPNGPWIPRGGFTLRCNYCQRRNEVIVITT